MKKIKRNPDLIFLHRDLKKLYSFKKFPIFMGATKKRQSECKFSEMSFYISKNSGFIQLNPLIPLNLLYPYSHNSGCIGKLWNKHHFRFAKFVLKQKPSKVLEIGGSHGILASEVHKYKKNTYWKIIEPNPRPIKNSKAIFKKGYFDDGYKDKINYDTIVHSHVLEHIYDLNKFFKNLKKFSSEGTKLIFSIPNMEVMLKKKYNNCLNFEHTVFLTVPYVKYFLSKYSFKLMKISYFLSDHSIFFYAKRSNDIKINNLKKSLFKKNKKIFMNYINHYLNIIKKINIKLNKFKNPIFLFGGHIFSQYLLEFGLNKSKIISILDNDPNKQNKFLYGTNLKIKSPQILKNFKNPVVLLKAGAYDKEIKKDILKNINKNTIFI